MRRLGDVLLDVRVTGDGPAVAFAHSLGTDLRMWDPLLDRLSCRAIRYDIRGHGLSPRMAGSLDDHATDLAALLDAHAPEGAVVVGVSVGGMIAQALAATRPDLVHALVLSNTGLQVGTAQGWAARIAAVEAGGVKAVAGDVTAAWFPQAWRDANPDAAEGWRTMLGRQNARGYADLCRALADADLTADAGRIACPTLCVGGTGDGSTPPDVVERLAAAIPGARLAMIDGAGHLPMLDATDRFSELLRGELA